MPVVTTDELFGKIRYQALELGEAYGYLKVFPPGERPKLSSLRIGLRKVSELEA